MKADFQSDNEAENPGEYEQDDALFLRLKRWFTSARDHSMEWRKEAQEDYAFVAGDQWSMEDKATLKDQLRPIISFNRVGTIIDSVSGMEVQNRQEVRFLPRQMGKVGVNELLTAAAKWFRDEADAEDEESDAFLDQVICGMGWVDTRLDYEVDPEGRSVDERIDPIEMYWDPVAKKKNLEDRRYQFRAKKFAIQDAREMFPDVPDELLHAAWADNMPDADQPHNALEAKFYKNDQSGRESGDPISKVLIVEAQWWDRKPFYRMASPDGQIVSFPEDKYNALKKQAAQFGVEMPKAVKSMGRQYYRAFIGAKILESGKSPYPKGFTINCMTGKRDRNKNTFYGLVRTMKDPQRWANKFFSSLIHQFSTSGKGVVIETDAVVNPRQFEEEWAKADGIKWAKPGSMAANKILQLNGPQMNAGVSQMMEYAIGSIRDVTGVNVELLGSAEKDQAGILEYQRKQAGMTILASFFDSLRRFRKIQGHVLLYYIREYFSDGRLIRIDGEEGAQYIPLVRNKDIETYDVIVDEAPSSPNQKERVWTMITQLMPVLQSAGIPPDILAEFIKYSPFPESLTQKIYQRLVSVAQQPPQIAPDKQADLQIKALTAHSNVERNRAAAIKDLSQAGIQGPGPGEQLMSAAVDALIQSGQSAQEHQQTMQQQAAQQAHEHVQGVLDRAHQQNLAAMKPQGSVQ